VLAIVVAEVELPAHLLAAAVAGVEVPRTHARGGGAGGTSKVTSAAGISSCGAVFSADAAMDLPVVAAWPMQTEKDTGWGTNGKERRRKENKK
jgi:hypothetical protein